MTYKDVVDDGKINFMPSLWRQTSLQDKDLLKELKSLVGVWRA